MQARECPFCNRPILEDSEFCLYCGNFSGSSEKYEIKFRVCYSCHMLIPDDGIFCMYCGNISRLDDKCEMRDCPFCYKPTLYDYSEYCVYCGNRVVVEKMESGYFFIL